VLNLLPLGTNNHLLRSQATGCRNEFSFSSFFFWKLGKKLTLLAIQFCGLTELIWKLSCDALIIISSIVKMLNTDCFEGQCFRIFIVLYSFGLLHIHMYMLSHNDKVRKVHLQKFNPFLQVSCAPANIGDCILTWSFIRKYFTPAGSSQIYCSALFSFNELIFPLRQQPGILFHSYLNVDFTWIL